jgi:hypothetical protein
VEATAAVAAAIRAGKPHSLTQYKKAASIARGLFLFPAPFPSHTWKDHVFSTLVGQITSAQVRRFLLGCRRCAKGLWAAGSHNLGDDPLGRTYSRCLRARVFKGTLEVGNEKNNSLLRWLVSAGNCSGIWCYCPDRQCSGPIVQRQVPQELQCLHKHGKNAVTAGTVSQVLSGLHLEL